MTRPVGGSRSAVALIVLAVTAACGRPARVALPQEPGEPSADAVAWLAEATAGCASVRSLTAEMALRGRIAGRRVRARVLAGTDAAGRVRLEAVAPFGAPIFLLTADEAGATLLLPREARIVTGASVEELLGALAGVRLSGADLHAALSGCGLARRDPSDARAHGRHWRAVALGEGATVWLERREPGVRLVVATLPGLSIEYGQEPATGRVVRLVASAGGDGERVDLVLQLSQIDENAELPRDAFRAVPPRDALPMSIEELRRQGLLAYQERQ
jgi:hypothetical protein